MFFLNFDSLLRGSEIGDWATITVSHIKKLYLQKPLIIIHFQKNLRTNFFCKYADKEEIFHPSIFLEISGKNILISSELF
jgi:hypothetical protein